jgi:hypothetical protein
MYSESPDGEVLIKLKHTDYESLLIFLGYALGQAVKDGEPQLADQMLQLANTINDGNPQWRRYRTTKDQPNAVQ